VTVRLRPSEATIVEQEAERCGIVEAEVYRTYGLRKLAGNVTLPTPGVLNWFVGAGQLLTRRVKESEISVDDLRELSAELGARKGEAKSVFSRRTELRRRSSSEHRTSKKSLRVTKKRKTFLEKIVRERELPSISTALGKGALHQIKESEHLEGIMELLTRWNDQANKILQEVSGSGDSIAEQDGMTEKIKALGAKMEKGAKRIHRARHN
jgi:hypothetical protein